MPQSISFWRYVSWHRFSCRSRTMRTRQVKRRRNRRLLPQFEAKPFCKFLCKKPKLSKRCCIKRQSYNQKPRGDFSAKKKLQSFWPKIYRQPSQFPTKKKCDFFHFPTPKKFATLSARASQQVNQSPSHKSWLHPRWKCYFCPGITL